MDLRNRHRSLIGLALVTCAALLVWFVLSGEHDNAPVEPTKSNAPIVQPSTPSERPRPQNDPERVVRESPPPSASGVLLGRVIDALTRKPVRDFTVEFHQAPGTIWRRDVPAGRDFRTRDGRFEWKPVPAGMWTITVSASGYQRFEIGRLRIDPDTVTTELVMPLRKGVVLHGRVIDASTGSAIREARVSFREADVDMFDDNPRRLPDAITSKDGTFVLDGVPPGRIVLTASARGYASRGVEIAVDAMTPSVDIALATGARISGRLVAQDGTTAVVGSAGLFDLQRQFGSAGRTNELGEFSFANLPPGRYRLTGRAEDGTGERDIALSEGQQLDVTLMLATGRTIRGTVSGLPPAELSRTRVSLIRINEAADLTQSEGGVDAQGAFELRGVRSGEAIIAANTGKREMRKKIDVPQDADVTVDLQFALGFRLSGRITRGGSPLGNIEFTLMPHDDEGVPTFSHTAADGRYAIDGVPRGSYSVVAARYRRPILISQDTELDIDIPTAELTGEILDEQGKAPVVGAIVQLWSTASNPRRARLMDQSNHFGRFSLGNLDAGSYVLSVFRPGFELHREQIEFPVQSSLTMRLSADEGVQVQARDATTGAPLRRLIVNETLGEQRGMRIELVLDDKGEAHLPSGLAGSTLSFAAAGYAKLTINDWSGQALRLAFRSEPGAQSD